MTCSTPFIPQTTTSQQDTTDVLLASMIDETVEFLCAPDPDMYLCLSALIEVANELRARNGTRSSTETEVANVLQESI